MDHDLFKVYWKEPLYFVVSLGVSVFIYLSLFLFLVLGISLRIDTLSDPFLMMLMLGIIILIITLASLAHLSLIGHLKGNAIEITEDQLPEIYEILQKQSWKLGLDYVPKMYLLQGEGILNAFAIRFLMTNYVILYNTVLEMAWTEGAEAVEFIIAHELGHIKRRHLQSNILILPARFVPFLNSAYSRACEYTCDNIGFSLSPEGARKGLLILAAGRDLYKKINLDVYLRNAQNASGFASWFAEIQSTHPHLSKRLANIEQLNREHGTAVQEAQL